MGISSLVDTWLLLRSVDAGGERNRQIAILKSRGMAHSNQVREFLLTDHGIELRDVYVGTEGVLTGSARLSQEAREQAATLAQRQTLETLRRERARKRDALEARIAALRQEFDAEEEDATIAEHQERERQHVHHAFRENMAQSRKADDTPIDGQPSPTLRGRK